MATHVTAASKQYYTTGQSIDFFKDIHDGLLDVGLTKTDDTGQLDLSTSGPTVTMNTADHDYGYSIFQFTDDYQSTYPIYLKVRYMNDSRARTSGQRAWVRIEVGEGRDGSGGLTGKIDDKHLTSTNTTTSNGTNTNTNHICFAKGTLVIYTGVQGTGNIAGHAQRLLVVGRRKDMSGAYAPGAYKIQSFSGSSSAELTKTVYESHISDYRTTIGELSHGNMGIRQSILAPYHWGGETTNYDYDNSYPVLPLFTLTPQPEYMSGVIATTTGIGFNTEITTDVDNGTVFRTTNSQPINANDFRLAYIWE
jgi:hypothetical protein